MTLTERLHRHALARTHVAEAPYTCAAHGYPTTSADRTCGVTVVQTAHGPSILPMGWTAGAWAAAEDERRDDIPRSGTIMCVRCNAPARTCEHAPEWLRRGEFRRDGRNLR